MKLAALCRREGVQLIHARSRAPAWVALGAARRLRVPFVTTYHGSYSGRTGVKVLYNSVMARGDVVIANSRYTADLIRDLHPAEAGTGAGDPPRHRPDFVQPPRGFTGAGRGPAPAWGVSPHERVVLLAARLTAWKGHRLLIEAAARMRDEGVTDLAIVLAGDPQGRAAYEREIDALVAARGLTGIVRRVGHCTDMPAAFRAASVVAVPSIEPEAFGRSAVEAQALGTPVVVSDLGAVPETVLSPPDVPAGQRTGWRVPPGDAAALAAALTEALSLGASAMDALARRCRAHVEAHFLPRPHGGRHARGLCRASRPGPLSGAAPCGQGGGHTHSFVTGTRRKRNRRRFARCIVSHIVTQTCLTRAALAARFQVRSKSERRAVRGS